MSDTGYRLRLVPGRISTDDILPARYKHQYTDPVMMAPHLFENCFPGFAATLKVGDALVGLDTFGIGSSREQAVSAMIAAGVRLVVAPSFGRIFYRNTWNLGLPAVECDVAALSEGQPASVDLDRGRLRAGGETRRFPPPSPMMVEMITRGGLLPMVADRIRARAVTPAETS